jgi:hypothetical protein
MPGGIDYSKWDTLDVSSSDEDSSAKAASGQNRRRTAPQIHTLQKPSAVTLDGQSHWYTGDNAPVPKAQVVEIEEGEDVASTASSATTTTNSTTDTLCVNGCQIEDQIYFSQTLSELTLHILVAADTVGKDYSVTVAPLPVSQQTEMGSMSKLLVQHKTIVLVDAPLYRAVEDAEDAYLWSIKDWDTKHRLISVDLRKQAFRAAPTLRSWWPTALRGSTHTIDVTTLQQPVPAVVAASASSTPQTQQQKKESFQKTWDEAHKMFRKRVQERKQVEIQL